MEKYNNIVTFLDNRTVTFIRPCGRSIKTKDAAEQSVGLVVGGWQSADSGYQRWILAAGGEQSVGLGPGRVGQAR